MPRQLLVASRPLLPLLLPTKMQLLQSVMVLAFLEPQLLLEVPSHSVAVMPVLVDLLLMDELPLLQLPIQKENGCNGLLVLLLDTT